MRATDFPKEWALVLSAMDVKDYDLAHKLVKKYHFNRDATPSRDKGSPFIYNWKSPNGKTGVAHGGHEMGKIMGIPNSAINDMYSRQGYPDVVEWKIGKRKGWVLERSLAN